MLCTERGAAAARSLTHISVIYRQLDSYVLNEVHTTHHHNNSSSLPLSSQTLSITSAVRNLIRNYK